MTFTFPFVGLCLKHLSHLQVILMSNNLQGQMTFDLQGQPTFDLQGQELGHLIHILHPNSVCPVTI